MSHNNNPMTTEQVAENIESHARLFARTDVDFALSGALVIAKLRDAEYETVEAMAAGDEDALDAFVTRYELGTFVFEHVVDSFAELARNELTGRENASKSALEVELELRSAVGIA